MHGHRNLKHGVYSSVSFPRVHVSKKSIPAPATLLYGVLNIESKEYYKAKRLLTTHPSFYNHGRQTAKLKEGNSLEDQGLEGRITLR